MLERLCRIPIVSFALDAAETYHRVGVARSAAALSYFLVLTLFPLLVCVNYFIGLFHMDLEQALLTLHQVLPTEALSVLEDYLMYIAGIQSPALLWASLFTILVSASAGLRTLFFTMDVLFQVKQTRRFRRTVSSVILSALFLVTVYLSVVVIFTGDWFFSVLEQNLPQAIRALFPLGSLARLWLWLRYLLLFCFVLLLVLAVYRVGMPRNGLPRGTLRLSALLTAAAMVGCSVMFSWFIDMSSRYALVYGSLASLIVLLVWLYFCGNILLLGAVISHVYHRRQQQRTES
ncbi:MAG: YihY/virulence factor BrkB family protein [Lawsonibacter sp.]